MLFTSEPTRTAASVAGCNVIGRYTIKRSTSAATAAALARGDAVARTQQQIVWGAKKLAKTLAGNAWFRFRSRVLRPYA
jgi:hypothetical protein